MERSQSTPDILADVESGAIETGTGTGGNSGGTWSKKNHQAPNPVYSSALQASNGAESSRLIAAVAAGHYNKVKLWFESCKPMGNTHGSYLIGVGGNPCS